MRISRQQVVTNIEYALGGVSQRVTIDETPDYLRHACFYTGVTTLPRQIFNVQTEEYGVIPYPYYFCPVCRKIYVYRHLYD